MKWYISPWQKLSEDNISGKLSDERFIKLSRDYEQEQEQLKAVVETMGREVKQQEQKKTNVRKFISVVKKYTDMTQLDATILREFVEQIRVSDTYTTDEQQKRVKIREIEIVYNFIGAFDFEGAREQSQTAQDKNNAKVGAAWRYADPRLKCFLTSPPRLMRCFFMCAF